MAMSAPPESRAAPWRLQPGISRCAFAAAGRMRPYAAFGVGVQTKPFAKLRTTLYSRVWKAVTHVFADWLTAVHVLQSGQAARALSHVM